MKIPIKYIIELGLIKKRDRCAKCDKKMDVLNYSIQLCKNCRVEELNKYAKEMLEKRIAKPLTNKEKYNLLKERGKIK